MAATPEVGWTEFDALGTYVHLQTTGDISWARLRAREILAAVDAACSRFRPDSDLSRANAEPGRWTAVSDLFLAALRVAVAAARDSAGILDPCVGRNLMELGYDADFDQVRSRVDVRRISVIAPAYGTWSEIIIGEGAVLVPAGTSLDFGATAKAWASDLVARTVAQESGASVLVSLGGDISVAGTGPSAGGWPIDITEHPGDLGTPGGVTRIRLDSGGLATSSTQVRRWRASGAERHHIVDPRTGRSATGPWRTVTATGPSCLAANVASTAAVVLGDAAVGWLDERGVAARLVDQHGRAHTVGGWPAPTATDTSC